MIDLRSDTVTKPSAAMRQAMANAEVGDDTFGEDPTITRLEETVAGLLGMEAALYVASGQLGNQLSLRIHGRGGDCVIAHEYSHIFEYETGAPSAISGLASRFIQTPDGTFTVADLKPMLRPENIHHSRNRILSIENTHNRCGGVVWDLEQYNSVCRYAHDTGMAVHLDGARLWNACASNGTELNQWTQSADSVSVCFSKGLGAPVGSAVCGTREFVEEARFYRKMFGGQMRQAGIIAAGALYAVEHNLKRLGEDHENANLLAEMISVLPGLSCIWPASNILMVEVTSPLLLASQIVAELAKEGVLLFDLSEKHMRLVTHLDVTRNQCQEAAMAFERVMGRLAG